MGLNKQHKINDDTWRYSLNSNDNAPEIETWSNHKLYICEKSSCSNQNGMEMKNIFDSDDEYQNYLHLVPHNLTLDGMQIDDMQNEHMSFFEHAFDAIRGLIHSQSNGLFDSFSNLWQNDDEMNVFYDDDYDEMDDVDAEFMSTMNMIQNEEFDEDDLGFNGLMDMASNLWTGRDVGTNNVHFAFINNAMNAVKSLMDTFNAKQDDQMNDDMYYEDSNGLFDGFSNLWQADTNYDDEYYYAYDEMEPRADKIEVIEIDDRELVLDEDENRELNTEQSVKKEEETDLIVIEITVIICIIMVCGMFYAAWRFLIDRRQKQRELGYYNGNLSNDLLIKSP